MNYRMIITRPLIASLLLFAAFLDGCDSPVSGTSTSAPDSLDAELGKDAFNTYDFHQGNILSTGNITDLAIEGHGMFVLKNGSRSVFFRRPASFVHDAEGYLTLGDNKTRLQGIPLTMPGDPYAVKPEESIPSDSLNVNDLVDIRWKFDERVPPRPTTWVKLSRNLDSQSESMGTILYSQKFMRAARGSDRTLGLMSYEGTLLGMEEGDILTFSAVMGGSAVTTNFKVGQGATLQDIAAAITAYLRGPAGAGPQATAEAVSSTGKLTLFGNTMDIESFQVTSNRPISSPKITQVFDVAGVIPAGTARLAVATQAFRAPAEAADLLADLFDGSGTALGLQSGDVISFYGTLGGTPLGGEPVTYDSNSTTMQDLFDAIAVTFQLPKVDGTLYNNASISLNAAGSDDNIPDGALVIRGQPSTALAIKDLVIRATDNDNAKPAPNFFNTNMNMTSLRDAVDPGVAPASLETFDATGRLHVATITFIATSRPNRWAWSIATEGDAKNVRGSRGAVVFGADGALQTLTFDDSAEAWEYNPGDGSANVKVSLLAGGPGDFTGLTEFRSASTVAAVSHDGFRSGVFSEISFDLDGTIVATYDNGQSRRLYRIPLARFPNYTGLLQVGKNSFLETALSGKPLVATPRAYPVALLPGALEADVD